MVQAVKNILKKLLVPVGCCLLLTSCFGPDGDGCDEKYITIPLAAEYQNWFKSTPAGNTTTFISVQSTTGLKESLSVSKWSTYEGLYQAGGDCTHRSGQTIGLNYGSSVYGYGINIALVQQEDGEKPLLRIYNHLQTTKDSEVSQLVYHLGGTRTYPVTFTRYRYDQSPGESIATNAVPEVTVLDSLVVGNRTFRQVYKVSNPYLKQEGTSYSLTDFFIDKDYGLVQYGQKDGTLWQIQF